MKGAIYIFLLILFIILILLSALLCQEYRSIKYIIFYSLSVPAFVGLFISAMILVITTINKNE